MDSGRISEPDFDHVSWHDCHVRGFEIRAGAPEHGDWTSELVFDIDYILSWSCATGGRAEFRVAPASLAFHGVTEPRLRIESADHGLQVAVAPWSIDRIEREPVRDQKVHLDRPYFRWTIRLNAPRDGEITFGAHGFTQVLTGPVLVARQGGSDGLRAPLRCAMRRCFVGHIAMAMLPPRALPRAADRRARLVITSVTNH